MSLGVPLWGDPAWLHAGEDQRQGARDLDVGEHLAAALLTGAYTAAFGLSHPLAKKIGAWPAVFTAAGASAAAAYLLSDADESLE